MNSNMQALVNAGRSLPSLPVTISDPTRLLSLQAAGGRGSIEEQAASVMASLRQHVERLSDKKKMLATSLRKTKQSLQVCQCSFCCWASRVGIIPFTVGAA